MYSHIFAFLARLHIFCLLQQKESLLFLFSSFFQLSLSFFFKWIHCCQFAHLKHKVTLTLSKRIIIYKTLIFALMFFHKSHILKKNRCKCFVLLTSVIVIQKNGVFFTKTDGYQKKMCDTNKNMTRMGVIIFRVPFAFIGYYFAT